LLGFHQGCLHHALLIFGVARCVADFFFVENWTYTATFVTVLAGTACIFFLLKHLIAKDRWFRLAFELGAAALSTMMRFASSAESSLMEVCQIMIAARNFAWFFGFSVVCFTFSCMMTTAVPVIVVIALVRLVYIFIARTVKPDLEVPDESGEPSIPEDVQTMFVFSSVGQSVSTGTTNTSRSASNLTSLIRLRRECRARAMRLGSTPEEPGVDNSAKAEIPQAAPAAPSSLPATDDGYIKVVLVSKKRKQSFDMRIEPSKLPKIMETFDSSEYEIVIS
jgi:hypothetical protein